MYTAISCVCVWGGGDNVRTQQYHVCVCGGDNVCTQQYRNIMHVCVLSEY